jgi:two-component system CheB/CheR fusion protein
MVNESHRYMEQSPLDVVASSDGLARDDSVQPAQPLPRGALRLVPDAAGAHVARCDTNRRYVWVNEGYARRLGVTPEDLTGKLVQDVIGREVYALVRPYIERALAGETVEYEVELFSEPAPGLFRVIFAPSYDASGASDGWTIVATDITRRKRLEESLRDYKALVTNLPVGVYICDAPSGTIGYYNRRASELWGREPRAGDDGERLFGGVRLLRADRTPMPEAEIPAARVLNGEPSVHNHEAIIERADGSSIAILINSHPLRNHNGHIAAAVTVFQDISEQKQLFEALQRSERLYRGIGESIDYGIWVCDAAGRNIYASESFLNLVGLTQEDCSQFGWGQVLHPDEADETLAAWKACSHSGTFWEREHRYRGVDGRYHHVLARGVPIWENDRIVCWAGINLDIAALKDAEAKLRDADRRKDEFLATLAHELRNPLAPIRSALQLLRLQGLPDRNCEWARDVIDRQVDQLSRLVDDLLDVSRITRGKIELRKSTFDLATLFERALETSQPSIDAAAHQLKVSLPDTRVLLEADLTRLAQVLSNLLNNATTYTPPGGTIELTAAVSNDSVEISVSDNGMGIPANMLPLVFDMFAQGQNPANRGEGGLGIGLTIVQRLVEMHGGTVRAASDGPGSGSTFVVTLPISPVVGGSDSPAPATAGSRPNLTTRHRILVVDDNRDAADTLSRLLALMGGDVETAYDGATALAKCREATPDIIFLDLGMPGLSGFDVAARLRADASYGRTVLVAMTGWGQDEDRMRSRAAGFDHHAVKPADPHILEALIAGLEPRR